MTAAQAGIPESLRYTDHTDLGPRIGFAWRPFGNDKTVVRGGWGRFIETPLGFSLVAGWAVASSYVPTYNQDYDTDGVTPLLSLDNPFNPAATGVGGFYYAFPIHYKDPTVQQWNLTVERNLGESIGLRLSYSGSHGSNLEAMEDLNQVKANTQGYAQASRQLAVSELERDPERGQCGREQLFKRDGGVFAAQRQGTDIRCELHVYARPVGRGRGCAECVCGGRRKFFDGPLQSAAGLRQCGLRPAASFSGDVSLCAAVWARAAVAGSERAGGPAFSQVAETAMDTQVRAALEKHVKE